MRVRRIIALIVGLAVDPRESTEYSLLGHRLDIAIDGCSSDLRLLYLDLIIYIIRREMSAGTSCTDDVTILMGSHMSLIMIINLKKATKVLLLFWFSCLYEILQNQRAVFEYQKFKVMKNRDTMLIFH
jgi:hypothetical protein